MATGAILSGDVYHKVRISPEIHEVFVLSCRVGKEISSAQWIAANHCSYSVCGQENDGGVLQHTQRIGVRNAVEPLSEDILIQKEEIE